MRRSILVPLAIALVACGASQRERDLEDTDADADVDADVDGDVDADTDVDADGDADADGDVDSDVDTDVDGDIDGDADVEPVCEGSGHDEDGDGVDDECDSCPTYVSPGQADRDEDGLGDACEWPERPDVLASLAAFDPLLGVSGDWATTGGTWTPGEDEIVAESRPYGANATYDLWVETPFSAETTFVVRADTAVADGWAGVVFAARDVERPPFGSVAVFWACLFERRSRSIGLWRYDGGAGVEPIAIGETGDGGSAWPRRIRVHYDGGEELLCTLEGPSGDLGSVTAPAGEIWEDMTGLTGVRVYNDRVAFSSFAIYR